MKILRLLLLGLCVAALPAAENPDALLVEFLNKVPDDGAAGQHAQAALAVGDARRALEHGDDAGAERAVVSLRAGKFASDPASAALLDRIGQAIHARVAESDAAANAALDDILAEVRKNFAAHAKPAAYDPLLERLARLPAQREPMGYRSYAGMKARIDLIRNFVARLQDYLSLVEQGNLDRASGILNQLLDLGAQLPALPRSELEAMQAADTRRHGEFQEARHREFDDRMAKLVARIQAQVDGAQKAADLDGAAREVTALQLPEDANRWADLAETTTQLDLLRDFLHRWQDYLSQAEAGDQRSALETLRSLSDARGIDRVYPRSRILARLYAVRDERVPVVLPNLPDPAALTVDNLGEFTRQFVDAVGKVNDPARQQEKNRLIALRDAQAYLKAGEMGAARGRLLASSREMPPASAYAPACDRVERAIKIGLLRRQLGDSASLPPESTDSLETYAQRLNAWAVEREDWSLAADIWIKSRELGGGPINGGDLDLQTFNNLAAAANFEKAEQYARATRSYLAALATGSRAVPAEVIGRRLNAIKSAHPKEFEEGQKARDPILPFVQGVQVGPGS